MGRFVVFSGPSCVGKGPLCAALARFRPDLWGSMARMVRYDSRAPRPGEQDGIDYHFRTRQEIEELGERVGFLVMEVRGELNGVDLIELDRMLGEGDVLYEGNPFVARALMDAQRGRGAEVLSIFLSPLSREEVLYLREPERHVALADLVADVMRRKLLRRTRSQEGELSLPDLQDIERRCTSAHTELKLAHLFDHIVPNHDGEDSENWNAFHYPLGDARRTLGAVADLLTGRTPAVAEKWEEGLVG
jgi:guanylate kinase